MVRARHRPIIPEVEADGDFGLGQITIGIDHRAFFKRRLSLLIVDKGAVANIDQIFRILFFKRSLNICIGFMQKIHTEEAIVLRLV